MIYCMWSRVFLKEYHYGYFSFYCHKTKKGPLKAPHNIYPSEQAPRYTRIIHIVAARNRWHQCQLPQIVSHIAPASSTCFLLLLRSLLFLKFDPHMTCATAVRTPYDTPLVRHSSCRLQTRLAAAASTLHTILFAATVVAFNELSCHRCHSLSCVRPVWHRTP